MARSTVFKSNKTQAVRIPKGVALPEHVKQVEVIKVGCSRIVSPAGESWTSFFEGPSVSEDFMSERNQPPAQTRNLR